MSTVTPGHAAAAPAAGGSRLLGAEAAGAGNGRGEPSRRGEKSPQAFRTISEVAQDLEVPPHVLRFWETKFSQVRPLKRGGGRRYYRPEDVDLLRRIRALLYREGYTIKGVQRVLREGSHAAEALESRPPPATPDSAAAMPAGEPPAARAGTPGEVPPWTDPPGAAPSPSDPPGIALPAEPESGAAEAAAARQAAPAPAAAPLPDAQAAPAAGLQGAPAIPADEWRQRLVKVLVDLRTVREVLQQELGQPAS